MKFLIFLKKPYPYEDSVKKKILISIAFGIFIGFFLFVFEPFGIYDAKHENKALFVLGYGLVTFISLLITYFIIPFIFKEFHNNETWTAGKEILHISLNIFLITIMNIFYSILFCKDCVPFQANLFEVLFFSFFSVLLIGMFPVAFMVLIYQNFLLKKHINNAEYVNQNLPTKIQEQNTITIYSNNKKNMLSLNSAQLLAIEANGNYINVYYEDKDKLNREIIRNTLKKTEDVIEKYSNFVRCHKSYIVNLSKLKKVTGNAQGYKLIFDQLDFKIPVSRNLSKQILTKIQS